MGEAGRTDDAGCRSIIIKKPRDAAGWSVGRRGWLVRDMMLSWRLSRLLLSIVSIVATAVDGA
eukprot:928288-Prymnesium_polylepis.2